MKESYGTTEIKKLISQLSIPKGRQADDVVSELLNIDLDQSFSLLLEALKSADKLARQCISFVLGVWSYSQDRCIPPLLGLLKDEDKMVKLTTIDSLLIKPRAEIIPHLAEKLYSEEDGIREAIVNALGKLLAEGFDQAREVVVKFIKDEAESEKLRCLAVQNLASFKEEQRKSILAELRTVQSAAVYAQLSLLEEEE